MSKPTLEESIFDERMALLSKAANLETDLGAVRAQIALLEKLLASAAPEAKAEKPKVGRPRKVAVAAHTRTLGEGEPPAPELPMDQAA